MLEIIGSIKKTLSTFITLLTTDRNFTQTYLINAIVYLIILILIFAYYYNINPKNILGLAGFIFFFILLFPLAYLIIYKNHLFSTFISKNLYNVLYLILFFIATTVIYRVYSYLSPSVINQLYILNYIFGFLAGFVALSLIFSIFGTQIKTTEGWTGFIIKLLFYLPCLLIDFINYIRNEAKITSNIIYILFIIEVVIALLYIYLSKLVNYIMTTNSVTVLQNPVYLNKKITMGDNEMFRLPTENQLDKETNKFVFRENYCVSFWIYINPQQSNNKSDVGETNIFDLGNGKPKMVYHNSKNTNIANSDLFTVYFSNVEDIAYYDIKLTKQKWHNIVFNYNSTIVDLFINGNLERSIELKRLPVFKSTDIITVGSNDGLYGSICNILYYNKPLTKMKIVDDYNLLQLNNPPLLTK